MKKLLSFTFLCFLLTVFVLAAGPAWADSVDEKIKALEQELSRLKGEQMELRREATAAAAALPTFTYRPGRGVTIEAADRRYSVNLNYVLDAFIYNATKGNDTRGSTTGDLNFRRSRPGFLFCVDNCFYDWGLIINFDTGNVVNEHAQWFNIHFEQINPRFPTLEMGDRTSAVPFPYVRRSASSSAVAQLPSDMLPDGAVDESQRRSIGFFWADHPIPWNLLSGDFTLSLNMMVGGGIFRNTVSDTDRKQFEGTFGLKPFNRSKNPWLERIKWGIGLQANSVDSRSAVAGRRLRIMTMERGTNRVTLLNANTIGDGFHHRLETGLEWGYGPYLVRAEGGVSRYASDKISQTAGTSDGFKGVSGGYWRIGHEIFLWSPKGLLTGSSSTPNSVQLGWAFERSQADCGTGSDCSPGTGAFSRNHLIGRELDLWYFITPAMRMGILWWWWDAANTPVGVQTQVGCTKNVNATNAGKNCGWHTVNLALTASF